MSAFDDWCEGKDPMVTRMVCSLTLRVDDLPYFFNRVIRQLFHPSIRSKECMREWSHFYQKQEYFDSKLFEAFFRPNAITAFSSGSLNLNDFLGDLLFRPISPDIKTNNDEMPNRESEDSKIDGLEDIDFSTIPGFDAVIFFLEIYLPCLFIFQERPMSLYRKAIAGDIGSAEDLLKLDKRVITDPKFSQLWYQIMTGDNNARKKIMLAAISSPATSNIPTCRIKYYLGALIQRISEIRGKSLKPSDIRKLFDALARDRDGSLYDADFPISEQAFYRALSRAREDVANLMASSPYLKLSSS